MICFVINGVNIYDSKHNLIVVKKKMYDILMIFANFCWNLPWFWLIFCYPDPDLADQNATDSNGSGSETLLAISSMYLIRILVFDIKFQVKSPIQYIIQVPKNYYEWDEIGLDILK